MKRITAVLLAVLMTAAVLSFASCGKDKPKIEDFPVPEIPEDYDESTTLRTVGDIVKDMTELKNIESSVFVRGVTTGSALLSTLGAGKDEAVKLSGTDESLLVPSADYKNVTLIVDSPANLTLNASFKAVAVYSAGEEGVQFAGSAETFAVFGQDVKVEFSGSANTVYIEGKNCTLTFSGKCDAIVNMNTSTVIINATENDIAVLNASGSEIVVPAGETFSAN